MSELPITELADRLEEMAQTASQRAVRLDRTGDAVDASFDSGYAWGLETAANAIRESIGGAS